MKLKVNWKRGMAFMMLPILFVPMFLFKGDLTAEVIIIDSVIAFLVLFPLGVKLGICFVPIEKAE